MKIAILSDIHGNYPALKSVVERIDMLGCDFVYVLGDIAGYYCMVNECIDLIRKRNYCVIMGNHDYYIAFDKNCPRSNAANVCLDYQRKIISKKDKDWLKNLPLKIENENFSMVHAGWNDPLDEYMLSISNDYFRLYPQAYFFSGHTHVQILKEFSTKVYCNPGSVGQPRDGDPKAAFAVLSENMVTLHRVDYDIDEICIEMDKSGFSSYYYENLYKGSCIGGKIINFPM